MWSKQSHYHYSLSPRYLFRWQAWRIFCSRWNEIKAKTIKLRTIMKILILQHIKYETPGYIKDLMLNDGFELVTIELDTYLVIFVNLMACFVWAVLWILGWKKNILG